MRINQLSRYKTVFTTNFNKPQIRDSLSLTFKTFLLLCRSKKGDLIILDPCKTSQLVAH